MMVKVNDGHMVHLVTGVTAAVMCLCADSTERPLVIFRLPDNHKTTRLLLSNDGSTLYVGAQDALFSLDVSQSDVIQLKKKVSKRWFKKKKIYFINPT